MNAKEEAPVKTCVFCGKERTDPYFCWGCGAYKVSFETRNMPLGKQPYALPSMLHAEKMLKRRKKKNERKIDKQRSVEANPTNGKEGHPARLRKRSK